MPWYGNGWNGWWWHMGFMSLFWVVLIVVVVWALVRGVEQAARGKTPGFT